MKAILGAAAILFVITGSASAQTRLNYSLDPHFGTARLSAGFQNDPHEVNLTAGGPIAVSEEISGCRGYVSRAPDVRLHWSGGGSLPLIFSADSNRDTTLVINAPDGRWYCDDDSGEGLNPSLRFGRPMSGQYDIWVGSYSGDYVSATLSISELYSN